ncbi:MAG: hypothetical protein ACLFOY_13625, partial [Desulfatibacillaceae bacterium]
MISSDGPGTSISSVMAFTLFMATVLLFGPTAGAAGRLERSSGLTEAFYSHRPLDGYTYYLTGSKSRQDAIIGIKDDWTLRTDLWKRFDATRESLRDKVDLMSPHPEMPNAPYQPVEKRDLRRCASFLV